MRDAIGPHRGTMMAVTCILLSLAGGGLRRTAPYDCIAGYLAIFARKAARVPTTLRANT
jgi:hypothetical protein